MYGTELPAHRGNKRLRRSCRLRISLVRGHPPLFQNRGVKYWSGLLCLRRLQGFMALVGEAFDGVAGGKELHGDIFVVVQLGKFFVDVKVVDFPAAGLMTAGNVSDMY